MLGTLVSDCTIPFIFSEYLYPWLHVVLFQWKSHYLWQLLTQMLLNECVHLLLLLLMLATAALRFEERFEDVTRFTWILYWLLNLLSLRTRSRGVIIALWLLLTILFHDASSFTILLLIRNQMRVKST